MKTFVKLVLLVALIVYLAFAFLKFSRHGNDMVCQRVNYTIADSSHAGFITAQEADRLLSQSNLYPVGRKMDDINGPAIEAVLRKNSFIDSVSCYKSPNGELNVMILQRLPLIRVIADNGDSYYMDQRGNFMNPQGYVADLVVATGHIDRNFARTKLLPLGRFLHDDPFWNAQIEQIYVEKNHELRLVPRVGNHIISFGVADSISQKFRNLYTFYEKVLPQVGWNKYSVISVEHVTQIVGKKGKS